MKANMSQLLKRNKKGKLVPTWRHYLGMFLGSIEGTDDTLVEIDILESKCKTKEEVTK